MFRGWFDTSQTTKNTSSKQLYCESMANPLWILINILVVMQRLCIPCVSMHNYAIPFEISSQLWRNAVTILLSSRSYSNHKLVPSPDNCFPNSSAGVVAAVQHLSGVDDHDLTSPQQHLSWPSLWLGFSQNGTYFVVMVCWSYRHTARPPPPCYPKLLLYDNQLQSHPPLQIVKLTMGKLIIQQSGKRAKWKIINKQSEGKRPWLISF